jgi:hypothetical protein
LNLFSAKQTDVATAASSNLKSKFLKLTGIGSLPAVEGGILPPGKSGGREKLVGQSGTPVLTTVFFHRAGRPAPR